MRPRRRAPEAKRTVAANPAPPPHGRCIWCVRGRHSTASHAGQLEGVTKLTGCSFHMHLWLVDPRALKLPGVR